MRLDLYQLAHTMKEKVPFIWNAVEKVNELLFLLRYGRKIKTISVKSVPDGFRMAKMKEVPTERIVEFFQHQPEMAFKFFNPHKFDGKRIKQLQKNESYLAYLLLDKENDNIAGYCFNRCFFMGKGFRGRMVDINYRGKGLGTAMNKILNEVGFSIGFRLFETVSKNNVASYRSAISASNVRVIKELPHNELFLEIQPE